MNYIYVGSDDRYYYNVVPMPMTGTIYTSLQNGTINDSSALFRDMTPEQVIAHMEQNETILYRSLLGGMGATHMWSCKRFLVPGKQMA